MKSAFAPLCFLCASLLFVAIAPAQAQLVADGATRTLNNVSTNINGTVTVGTNGSFTLLVLTNGTLLTNSGYGAIGRNTGANSNTVYLTGNNTRWLMSLDLLAGSNGAFNRLVVSNGARVESTFGSIGVFGSNNEARVTGAGSLWSNRNDLYVGYIGRSNRLLVTNGGWVTDYTGGMGVDPASFGNVAAVAGAGSVWSNRGSLFIGLQGSINTVYVTNNGTIVASNGVILGSFAGSTNNLLIVDGGTIRVSNATNTGTIEPRGGTLQFDGGLIDADVFVMTNSLGKIQFSSGTLVTRGTLITNASITVGNLGDGAVWDLRAGPFGHFVNGNISVSQYGDNNFLLITNGAALTNHGAGNFCVKDGYSNNGAIISGTGSRWDMSGDLIVGSVGTANLLVISNAANVSSTNGFVGSGGDATLALLSAASWTNRNDLTIGNTGVGNRLIASNGAAVFASNNVYIGRSISGSNNFIFLSGGAVLDNGQNVLLGYSTGSSGNGAFLSDTNTRWDVGLNVFIGSNAPFNTVVVSNGALLSANGGVLLGYNAGAFSNSAVITGAGTRWTGDAAGIGVNGAGNRLEVSGGARFSGLGGYFGLAVSSSNNSATVTDAGSYWSMGDNLTIGNSGGSNRLLVAAGGGLKTDDATIGYNTSSSNNVVTVTGSGSGWTNLNLTVGRAGQGNRLVISNGGFVVNNDASIGNASPANEVVVTGAGSLWTNRGRLLVGESSSQNRLTVANGGMVTASNGVFVGFGGSGSNRIVIVSGVLRATNALGNGLLDVRRGTNELFSGLVEVDRLLVTNTLGQFEFLSGTLITSSTTNNNGRIFDVGTGDGVGAAVLNLAGNGTHFFANGLRITASGSLIGNGTIIGTVTVQGAGVLSPGTSIGKLTLNNSPSLAGDTVMEISKNGAALTNDQIQVNGPLTYGGALIVTKIGPTALSAGDQFPLFSATSRAGSFSSITLPALGAGLAWTNKLLVNGSIQVVANGQLFISSAIVSGTNIVISGAGGTSNGTYRVLTSTNVVLALTNWTRILTNQFDASGHFVFSNGISPATPRKFYTLQSP